MEKGTKGEPGLPGAPGLQGPPGFGIKGMEKYKLLLTIIVKIIIR